MLKVLKKIYPKPKNNNYNKLNYDNEGLWSITHPNEADIISKTILKYNLKESRVIDLTAGCGGNLLSFGKYFNNVVGIENDFNRYNILKNNISCYDFNIKVYHDDCSNYLNKDYDVYFLDPPWGGPDYKFNENLKLYLSDVELIDAIDMIAVGEYSEIISTAGGNIILKLNDKKEEKTEINREEEMEKLIRFKKNQLFSEYSIIYYKELENKAYVEKL